MSSKLQAPNKQEMSLSIPAYTHNPIFILKNCFGHSPYIRPSNVLGAGIVAKLHPTLCDAVNCSTPGFPVLHCLLEFAQIHVHWVSAGKKKKKSICWSLLRLMSIELVMPSNHLILCGSSPFAFNLSRYQGLFQLVGFSHQVAKVLELKRQHQSSLWIFRVDFF